MLDILLALDGKSDGIEWFIVNEFRDAITSGETFGCALSVFENPPDQVVRHSDIESASRPACKNIHVILTHVGAPLSGMAG